MKEKKNSKKDKVKVEIKSVNTEIGKTVDIINDANQNFNEIKDEIKTIETKKVEVVEVIKPDEIIIKTKIDIDSIKKIETTIKPLNINHIDIVSDKYHSEETEKKQIILHHTGTGKGLDDDFKTFVEGRKYFTTHFIISRNGDIFQLVDDKYWSEHLNIPGHVFNTFGLDSNNKELEMKSISIELDSLGELYKVADNKYRDKQFIMTDLADSDVTYYKDCYKQEHYYESYTVSQLEKLGELLEHLCSKHQISIDYKGDEIFNLDTTALSGENGIYSHSAFDTTKSDCHPQPELITLLKNLK